MRSLRRYPVGGKVRGPGTSTSDSIDARLSDGEYVLPAKTVEHVGKARLDRLVLATNGKPPVGMAVGGLMLDPEAFMAQNLSESDQIMRRANRVGMASGGQIEPDKAITVDFNPLEELQPVRNTRKYSGKVVDPRTVMIPKKPVQMADGGSLDELFRQRYTTPDQLRPTNPVAPDVSPSTARPVTASAVPGAAPMSGAPGWELPANSPSNAPMAGSEAFRLTPETRPSTGPQPGGLAGLRDRYLRPSQSAPTLDAAPAATTSAPQSTLRKLSTRAGSALGRAAAPLAAGVGGYELGTGIYEGDTDKMTKGALSTAAGLSLATPLAPVGATYLATRAAQEGLGDDFIGSSINRMLGPWGYDKYTPQDAEIIGQNLKSSAQIRNEQAAAPKAPKPMPPAIRTPGATPNAAPYGGERDATQVGPLGFVKQVTDQLQDPRLEAPMDSIVGNKGGRGVIYSFPNKGRGANPTPEQQADARALAATEAGQLRKLALDAAAAGDRDRAYRLAMPGVASEVDDVFATKALEQRAAQGSRRAQEALNARAVQNLAMQRTLLEHQDRETQRVVDLYKHNQDVALRGQDFALRRDQFAHQRAVDLRNFQESVGDKRFTQMRESAKMYTTDPKTGAQVEDKNGTDALFHMALATYGKQMQNMSPAQLDEVMTEMRRDYATRQLTNDVIGQPLVLGKRGQATRIPQPSGPLRKAELWRDVVTGPMNAGEYAKMKLNPFSNDEVQEVTLEDGTKVPISTDRIREYPGLGAAGLAATRRAKGGILRKVK